MSKIWFYMMLSAICVLLFVNPQEVVSEMLSSSANALSLCIELIGIYAVWLGILEILDKSGLSLKLANLLNPIIKFLFKSDNSEANKYIAINMASNILGLGNAATPSGIKAMELLDDKSQKATFSATMLIVINSVSIQLLPTTVIGLRESANSVNSTSIILPTIISSFLTATLAVCLVFLFTKLSKKKTKRGNK